MSVRIVFAGEAQFEDAWVLVQEYYEAVQVVVRDASETLRKYIDAEHSGVWVAYVDAIPAGCIVLRPLGAGSGEVKRLYVREPFRRLGLAAKLLAALEAYAETIGLRELYLDSKDDLVAAIAFYRRSGYVDCERYNDNPQATVFLKKGLGLAVILREFQAGDGAAFQHLNEAWITKLFKLEEKDFNTLREPQKYILSKGGRIYMACRGEVAVGCCALLQMDDGSYELAKMGVAESERGQGVGRMLLEYVVGEARRLKIRRLYLETNHILTNAIHLYEAVGFRHLGADEITPSPYARADVFMELLLTTD